MPEVRVRIQPTIAVPLIAKPPRTTDHCDRLIATIPQHTWANVKAINTLASDAWSAWSPTATLWITPAPMDAYAAHLIRRFCFAPEFM